MENQHIDLRFVFILNLAVASLYGVRGLKLQVERELIGDGYGRIPTWGAWIGFTLIQLN